MDDFVQCWSNPRNKIKKIEQILEKRKSNQNIAQTRKNKRNKQIRKCFVSYHFSSSFAHVNAYFWYFLMFWTTKNFCIPNKVSCIPKKVSVSPKKFLYPPKSFCIPKKFFVSPKKFLYPEKSFVSQNKPPPSPNVVTRKKHLVHQKKVAPITNLSQCEDWCNIPWNLPPTFIWTRLQQHSRGAFFSLCALLFRQSHQSPICVVWTCNDSKREIFTSFAEFQGIVSVNDFRIPLGFQTFASFSGFLVKFWSCTDTPGSIGWPDPAPRLHIGDCFEIRNCR